MRSLSPLFGVLVIVCVCLSSRAEDHSDSCKPAGWFQLQAEAAAGKISLLCEGEVDASFERRTAAEKELRSVIRKSPHSPDAADAHYALIAMDSREGRYREAFRQMKLELADKPDANDLKGAYSLFALLAQFPDQTVVSGKPSTVHSEIVDNNLFVPVTANGVVGTYIVDSGANISVMCESEARRLGLKVKDTTTKMFDISGNLSGIRIAEVPDLWIGKTHLKHVAFAVSPDANEPWVDLPAGHKGILGIPVLIALGAIRIDKGNRVELQVHSLPSASAVPLAFDDAMPVTQMRLDGKTLNFTFDAGASRTYLNSPFAEAFPKLMQTGSKRPQTVTGLSGKTVQPSVVLPSVLFWFGTRQVQLAPATVLLKPTTGTSNWAAGNLGFDLIKQALPITIDFRTMQLSDGNN